MIINLNDINDEIDSVAQNSHNHENNPFRLLISSHIEVAEEK